MGIECERQRFALSLNLFGFPSILNTGGPDVRFFKAHTTASTLVYNKPPSTRMDGKIIKKHAGYVGLGDILPHGLRGRPSRSLLILALASARLR